MPKTPAHKWTFRARFRRRAFGWRSQPAIKRIKEAVAEIKKTARQDPTLAAEGAVLFLEKLSPAIEQVDSSSGSTGNAVNKAVSTLSEIIAVAPADDATRERWLEHLWHAFEADHVPYLESLGHHWGTLCATPQLASTWADRLLGPSRAAWRPDRERGDFFKGTAACLSALLAAGRHEDALDLLQMAPYQMWHYRQYGVKALAAMGRRAEAIRFAEDGRGIHDDPALIARACEELLLSSGLADEAYERYGLVANEARTYLTWFRNVTKKYPHKTKADVLADLVAHTPGEEGKWFAAAKSAKLFDEAIALARRSPCSPQTLIRAARDFEEKNPAFAIEASVAALHWLVLGYGYDINSGHVISAYTHAMNAAEHVGAAAETRARIQKIVAGESSSGDRFVSRVLGTHMARL